MRLSLRPLLRGLIPTPVFRPVRGSKHGRARFAVLAGLLVLSLAQLGLGVVVETARPEWRDPEYGHRIKQLRAMARHEARLHPGRPLLVVLGSSRVAWGVRPDLLCPHGEPNEPIVYNFAHTGNCMVGERLSLRRLVRSGLTPRYLLVEVVPAFASGASSVKPASVNLPELEEISPYSGSPNAMRARWLNARIAPWSTLRYSLLSHWGADWLLTTGQRTAHTWEQMKVGGWIPYFPKNVSDEMRTAALDRGRKDYAPYFTNFHIDPLQDRALRDLLDECRERGISAALFWMPESPTYRSWYPPGGRTMFTEYLNGLGAIVLNCSEWIDDETAFWDGSHLLGPAAETFSERFAKDCVAPWLREVRP